MNLTIELVTAQGAGIMELTDATNREVTRLLGRTNTVSFQVPLASDAVAPIMSGATLLAKVYDGARLDFVGELVSRNRVGGDDSRSLSAVFADPSWVFSKRLVGKTASGQLFTTLTDRGAIAATLIDAVNYEWPTHVNMGPTYLSGSTSTYQAGPFAFLSTVVQDLSAGAYGFDWTIDPLEPQPTHVPVTYWGGATTGIYDWGTWRAQPTIGNYRPDVVFHHTEGGPAGGGNMKSYTDTWDRMGQANRVYHVVENDTQGTAPKPIIQTGGPSLDQFVAQGYYEDVVSAALSDTTLRQSLVDEHARVRSKPRRTVVFTSKDYDPADPGDVPRFGRDFFVGDVVRGVVDDFRGTVFDGYFRVYGYTSKPNDLGLEQGVITLADESGAPGLA